MSVPFRLFRRNTTTNIITAEFKSEQSDTGVDDAGSSDKVMTDTAESDAAVSLEAEEESMGRKLKS